jgi:hypothetical protein
LCDFIIDFKLWTGLSNFFDWYIFFVSIFDKISL